MKRLLPLALLALLICATNAHAGYYKRVPSSSNGRYVPSPGRDQGDFQQENTQNLTNRQQMQNEIYQQRLQNESQQRGEVWPDMGGSSY